MNVSLTHQLEKLVQKKVASGRYSSASEVVREALRLLEVRDRVREARIAALRRQVARGTKDLKEGRYSAYDPEGLDEFFDGVVMRGKKRLAGRKKAR